MRKRWSIFAFIKLNHLAIMDEAIAGTYWVAGQNGVSYTEEQIQANIIP